MFIYNRMIKELRDNIFIFHESHYKSKNAHKHIERYYGKHKAATPEIVVINDQAQGFKRNKKTPKSLEDFHIQCEIEYSIDTDYGEDRIIEGIELICDIKTSLHKKLQTIESIAKKYKKQVTIERSKVIFDTEDNESTLLISSNLNQIIYEHFFEEELNSEKISEATLKRLIHQHFEGFMNCLVDISQSL